MRRKRTAVQNGFTLIELMLYVGIAATVLLAAAIFFSLALEARIKAQVVAEVEQQGEYAMRIILQSARNADAVNAPATSTSDTVLSFAYADAAKNPTVFAVSSGALAVTEGSGQPAALTSARVAVSAIQFFNLSRTGTPGMVRAQFTLSAAGASGRSEYAFSKTFYGSASLR